MKFKELLRQIMKARGLSQTDIAGMAGVSQTIVSRWLRTDLTPRVEQLSPLAKALGVTVADLTGEEPLELSATDRRLLALPDEQKELVVKFFEFIKSTPNLGEEK